MAKSPTEICNLALSWLGGNTLLSLEHDDSREAILCRANYEPSRKAVLEEREWTFSVGRKKLTPLVTTPPFGYTYEFLIPFDVLVLINVYSTNNVQTTVQHAVEGNKILANHAEIMIKYKNDVTNTVLFSNLFDQALAAHIAANLSTALTEDTSMKESMMFIYEDKLTRATTSDSLQGSREMLETSITENARRLGVIIR